MRPTMDLVSSIVVLALLTQCSGKPTPWQQCYEHCQCEQFTGNHVQVICNTGNLTTLPPFTADNNVFILDLTHNKLVDIPADSFQSFPNLKELILDYNQITGLDNFALRGLENLEKLSLANNKMVDIEPGCFNGNPSLLYLSLRGNPLQVLFDTNLPFLDSLSIEELDLSECDLTTIQAKSFNGLEHLQVLNLNRNRLVNLPVGVFNGLSHLKELHLDENAWECDEELKAILIKFRDEKEVTCLDDGEKQVTMTRVVSTTVRESTSGNIKVNSSLIRVTVEMVEEQINENITSGDIFDWFISLLGVLVVVLFLREMWPLICSLIRRKRSDYKQAN